MDILITILIFGVILFVLVVIHEWGHYIAAKKSGVIVEEFGFGLPPRVWGRKFGPAPKPGQEDTRTLWSINLLPLGGFVRPRGEDSTIYDPTDRRNMQNAPLINRIAIVLAGPFMNFVLGILLFAIVYSIVGIPKSNGVFVSSVYPIVQNELSLQSGDKIASVDGQEIRSITQLDLLLSSKDGKEVTIAVQDQSGTSNDYTITVNKEQFPGVFVERVNENSPASEKGIEKGDVVLSADSQAVNSVAELRQVIASKLGNEVVLELLKSNGVRESVPVLARSNPPEGQGALGVVLNSPVSGLGALIEQDLTVEKYAWYIMPFAGIQQGFRDTYDLTRQILPALADIGKSLFAEQKVPEGVGGPVQIAGVVSQLCVLRDPTSQQIVGIEPVSCMQIAALLSINLAVFNLLPIPALDGGRFAFYLVEAITRRRVSPRIENWAHTIGFALLILLMILVTYNDIVNPTQLFR